MAKFTWEANKIRVFIGGNEIRLLSEVSGVDTHGLDPIAGIGDYAPVDLARTAASFRISLSGFVMKTTKAVTSGLWPESADDALKGKEFTVEIFSKDPTTLLKKYEGAQVAEADIRFGTNRQMLFTMTLLALNTSGTLN